MINITHKSNTLRKAVATATVRVSSEATIQAILEKRIPKGDVLEFARVAGLFGVKKTAELIPDCHPLPVEYTSVNYHIHGLDIDIAVEVHTVYKTGVEVEAMHGASIVALTLYDMLKPIDKHIEICSIKLLSKKGGKSDFKIIGQERTAAVVVCSDTISAGNAEDTAGKTVAEKLKSMGLQVADVVVIPDAFNTIQDIAKHYSGKGKKDLLVFVGGTGLSPRDVTPDAIAPLIDREIEGLMETARQYGQSRMPFANLSRGVAGLISNTLVLTVPGSRSGAAETMDALFPAALHVFDMLEGKRH